GGEGGGGVPGVGGPVGGAVSTAGWGIGGREQRTRQEHSQRYRETTRQTSPRRSRHFGHKTHSPGAKSSSPTREHRSRNILVWVMVFDLMVVSTESACKRKKTIVQTPSGNDRVALQLESSGLSRAKSLTVM